MNDRLMSAVESLVRRYTRRVDYAILYPCTVLADHGDMTLDLQPDNVFLPALTAIALWVGVPGLSVQVKPGAKVLLGFRDARPDQPYAALFGAGGLSTLTLTLDGPMVINVTGTATVNAAHLNLGGPGGAGVARLGDPVQVTDPQGGIGIGTITGASSVVSAI
jgi:hypothetical protein